MNGTMGFLLAVGGVSAIIYWLTTRADNRAARRSDGSSNDYSYDSSSSIGGWSLTNWFSSSSPSSDNSGASGASGGWDSSGSDSSGGGGDSGGGGGDGGGGSD